MRPVAAALVLSILFYSPTAGAEQRSESSYTPTSLSSSAQESETPRLDKLMSTDTGEGIPRTQKVSPSAWSLSASGPLFVQAVPGEPSDTTPREVELAERIRALEIEKAEIRTGGPRASIIGGAVATGVGFATFLAVTIASCGFNCGSGPTEATAGIGGGLGLAGLITLGTGLSLRKKRRAQMSEIDQEIDRINRERSEESPRLGARISLGEEKMLVLSLQY